MATRTERVVLELDDRFTTKMAKAAAAAALLKKQLDRLEGSADGLGDGLGGLGDETEGVGEKTKRTTKQTKQYTLEMALAEEKSARLRKELREQARAQLDAATGLSAITDESKRASPEIDRLSGRLRLYTDLAVTLGPALLRLGAGTIPVLTGSLAGLGAAAGAIGVTALALQGVGDGIEALNAYQLEPTAENLNKMKLAMEQLGPSGAHFVQFLDSLEPRFREVQTLARDGLFPGVEAGITSAMERLPEVRRLVTDLATGLGELAARAGESLGGPAWQAFFDYLATDARPTLEAFATSIGNVGLGIANMLVAFAPASRDFTGGLEDMTRRFAEWTAGLDRNQSFQSFLQYVRESGPMLLDFAGSLVQLAAGFAKAAAPVGDVALPALTALADVLGAIGQSSVGPAIYGAVAAFVALNRVADLSSGSLERFGISADKTRGSISKFTGLAAGVVGVSMAVGALADNINRIDSENLDRSLTALSLGNVTEDVDKVIDSLVQLNSPLNKVDLGEIVTLGGLAGDSSLDKFADNVDQVDQALAQLVESGRGAEAADLFTRIQTLAGGRGISVEQTAKAFDAYRLALDNAAGAGGNFAGGLSTIAATLGRASSAATDLTGALAALNGWFDKRAAVRNYKDAIDGLVEGLKDGFSRDDVANIDAVGTSILQVAEGLQGKRRIEFLADARQQLVDFAKTAPPEVAAAVEKIIAKFDSKGLTSPPPIKLTAEQKGLEAALVKSRRAVAGYSKTKGEAKLGADSSELDKKVGDAEVKLRRTDNSSANPKIGARDLATGIIAQVAQALRNLNGNTATTYIDTVRRTYLETHASGAGQKDNPTQSAGGGTVPKSGLPYADRYHYMLADGEEVISNRYGQADRHRSLLKAINSSRYLADGGTTDFGIGGRGRGGRDGNRGGPNSVLLPYGIDSGAKSLARALRELEHQVKKSEKAYDNEQKALDALTSKRDSIAGSVSDRFSVDLGSALNPLAAIASATNQANAFPAIIQSLNAAGLTGPALEQVIQQLSFGQLQSLAADPSKAGQYQTALSGLYAAQGAAGSTAGDVLYGQAIAEQSRNTAAALAVQRQELQELRLIKNAIKVSESRRDQRQKQRDRDDKPKKNDDASANARRRSRISR